MRRLFTFLSDMDAQAWRTLAVSFLLFGGVGMVFVFGAPLVGFNGETTVTQWLHAAHGPCALPVRHTAKSSLLWEVGSGAHFLRLNGESCDPS